MCPGFCPHPYVILFDKRFYNISLIVIKRFDFVDFFFLVIKKFFYGIYILPQEVNIFLNLRTFANALDK